MDGVIFIATGEFYAAAAARAAATVREHMPGIAIDIYTDVDAAKLAGFDMIHHIATPHRRSKVDCLSLTRFDRTLYLDSDTEVVADIRDVFDLLDRFDMAIAHAHSRNRRQTRAVWREALPEAFCQFNGGVLAYRSSQRMVAMLEDWSRSYAEAGFAKDQVTLRELIWSHKLNFYVLPPEYNIRYEKYLSVWDESEAQPKILHLARFHDRREARSATSAQVPKPAAARGPDWLRRLRRLARLGG